MIVQEKKLNYQGHFVFYRVIGKGKPVALIHGFGEDGTVWQDQIEFSKEKFCLIIPDLPGSGRSEIIKNMSMEGMAEVIKKILENELSQTLKRDDGKVIMIGHSMGGYITLAFAEKYPEYLNAFGLFHSTAYADSEEKKAVRRKGIAFIEQHGAFEFLKTALPNQFSPVSRDKMQKNISEFIQGQNNFSPDALVLYYKSMMQRPDRTEVLLRSKVPVLFVMGKYDIAAPMEDVLKQCHLPEKSYIHILERSGHMGMMEEPDKSNRLLENFLNEN